MERGDAEVPNPPQTAPAAPGSAGSAGASAARTGALIGRWVADGHLLGAQVFLARRDEVLADVAFGHSEPGRPATTSDAARLYCTAKPLTALCVAQAVQERLLSWDDPVSRFLPVAADPRHQALTLRALLSHASGLPPAREDCYAEEFPETVRKATVEEIPPWAWYAVPSYNNTFAWHILAAVREVVEAAPVDEVVRRRIAEPLGLPDLGLTGPTVPERYVPLVKYVEPHVFERSPGPAPERLRSRVNPAHGGVASAADLGALYQELLRCEQDRGILLTADTLAEMLRPQASVKVDGRRPAQWGLGIGVDFGDRTLAGDWSPRTFGHRGTVPVRTVLVSFADPARGAAAVIRLFSVDGRSSWRVWKLAGTLLDDFQSASGHRAT